MLVNGRTFAVADSSGGYSGPGHGAVFEDQRFLSRFVIRIAEDGQDLELSPLIWEDETPFSSVALITAGVEGEPEPGLAVWNRAWVGRGLLHNLVFQNLTSDMRTVEVSVEVDADFAHLFDMKAGKPHGQSARVSQEDGCVMLTGPSGRMGTRLTCDPRHERVDVTGVAPLLGWRIRLDPGGASTLQLKCEPVTAGRPAGILFPQPPSAKDITQAEPPTNQTIETSKPELAAAFERASEDIAALRIYDPTNPANTVIAAGAPWFMTLFGRDSLLTSWMTIPFQPGIAHGVLHALAELQGTATSPETEEEPGKIIHELRRPGGDEAFAERGRYYGTVDATPLFVMVAHELWRWGHLDDVELQGLWPSIVSAVEWIQSNRTRNADGFLTYQRSTDVGLDNQGWKDSWDGVNAFDGALPDGPVALAEVQGYAYAALRSAAELLEHLEANEYYQLDPAQLLNDSDDLRTRFNDRFWVTERQTFATALVDDVVFDSVTTNPGHAIWAGVADADLAALYFDRVSASDMRSGWGLRTLSTECARYHPLSYHNGSVWPHDTSLVIAGAARTGHYDLVDSLVADALDAASQFDGRPPELFAGFCRTDIPVPVHYPSSCSPQAWSSASTLLNVRSQLALAPGPADAPGGRTVDHIQSLTLADRNDDGSK